MGGLATIEDRVERLGELRPSVYREGNFGAKTDNRAHGLGASRTGSNNINEHGEDLLLVIEEVVCGRETWKQE